MDLPLNDVFKKVRKVHFKDFYTNKELDDFRRDQQLPATSKSSLPMNNLQTGLLGNLSLANTTKDTGTKDKTNNSNTPSVLITGVQNLLHTTQGFPGPNSNSGDLGFGDDNAMFSNSSFSNKRAPTYKDMFGGKEKDSDNKDNKPGHFSGNFSGGPSRAPPGNFPGGFPGYFSKGPPGNSSGGPPGNGGPPGPL